MAELPWVWWSPGSSTALWHKTGTYAPIPFDLVPPLPARRGGPLDWLSAAPTVRRGLGLSEQALDQGRTVAELAPQLDDLEAQASKLGLALPSYLRPFILSADLHGRVPTCTACYLDLPDRLIAVPDGHPGHLLRFMNDQQCCLVWYLLLTPGGRHQVACAVPRFDDDASPDATFEELTTPEDLALCAPSLDDFVYRFWLENTIWYATHSRATLPYEAHAYVDAVKRVRDRVPDR